MTENDIRPDSQGRGEEHPASTVGTPGEGTENPIRSANEGQGEERSIPPVGSSGINRDKLFWPVMIGLLAVAGIVAWGFGSFGGDKQPNKIVNHKQEQYKREKVTKFEIPKAIPQASAQQIEPPAEAKATVVAEPKQAQQIDYQAADRRRNEMEKRWSAPLVIYDKMDKQRGGASGADRQQEEKIDRLSTLQEQLLQKVNNQMDEAEGQGIPAAYPETKSGRRPARAKGHVTATVMDPEMQRYTVPEGTMLGAVLETAIQSNLAGKLRAIADEDVYSFDGRTLLIEKGSTLIGEYQTGLKQGEVRLFAIWQRLITPYGVDVELQSPGTDPLGRSGLSGWVDSHFWERFGSSLMLSIIGAYTAREASKESANSQIIAESVSENFNKSSEIALENSIKIAPTLHKNQGDLIKVFVARDINFKEAYLLSRKQRELATQ